MSDLAAQYNMAKCTISTFVKNKEATKAADVAKGVTIVHNKQRPQITDEVEKLLLLWIKEKELNGDSIREGIICEKAPRIYVNLLRKSPSTSAEGDCGFTFKASRGWFEKFKHRSGSHSVVRHGKVVSSNNKSTEECVGEFCDFVNAGDNIPQQVLNC